MNYIINIIRVLWFIILKDFEIYLKICFFRVVAVDMRGYGDSDKPSSISDYKADQIVEDIREFILDTGKRKCSSF